MDCSLPGSSVHGISQARILAWVWHYLFLGGGASVLFEESLTWFFLPFPLEGPRPNCVLSLAASVSSGSSLEMQVLGVDPRFIASEI